MKAHMLALIFKKDVMLDCPTAMPASTWILLSSLEFLEAGLKLMAWAVCHEMFNLKLRVWRYVDLAE